MTLRPLARIVKRLRSKASRARGDNDTSDRFGGAYTLGWISLGSSLAAALIVVTLVGRALADRADDRMDRFGARLAETTAQLGLPAVLQQDRIALGNLVNRVLAFDEVVGCSVYTVDGRTLAFAGGESNTPGTRHYTAAMAVEDTLAGYARVVLDRRRFVPGPAELVGASWPVVPVAVVVAGAMVLLRRRALREPPPRPATETAKARFVLVANLFNHGSLRDMRKKTVLAQALEHALRIADAHGGRARTLPGARVLIGFEDRADADRAFEVIAAAVAFGQTLQAPSSGTYATPPPSFRFGLHLGEDDEGAGAGESAHVSDAVLLSALAPDGRLAISQDVFERIERPERLEIDEASDLSQAALTGTTLGRCRIVNAVAAPPSPPADATFRLT
ncbi:MAG: hypothetical protein F4X99_12650 [Gammaproteobacteria bacterium]|nr:hypothetical protein [Gammaproteobacteria bacterium]